MSNLPPNHSETIKVGVLGCTGSVGQRFIALLANHPWFQVHAVGASPRSAGRAYKDAAHWILATPQDPRVGDIMVTECKPEHFTGCKIVFSGLDSSVAGEVEDNFANAGFAVFSNAKNHRQDPDVPLCVPTVNPEHMSIIPHQQQVRGYQPQAFILTNANCSSTGLSIALKPLHEAFGLEKVMVFTMQALSGAGYPGVSSMDILDNVIPEISGEEDKLENENRKILGKVADGNRFDEAQFVVSAHCNRVAVTDGHTECVSVKLKKPATPEQITQALRDYTPAVVSESLPSAPEHAIAVTDLFARPQPRLDRDAGAGMTVTVGRVRECPILDFKFTLLSHNTVIGAAGSAILNAEYAVVHNYVK